MDASRQPARHRRLRPDGADLERRRRPPAAGAAARRPAARRPLAGRSPGDHRPDPGGAGLGQPRRPAGGGLSGKAVAAGAGAGGGAGRGRRVAALAAARRRRRPAAFLGPGRPERGGARRGWHRDWITGVWPAPLLPAGGAGNRRAGWPILTTSRDRTARFWTFEPGENATGGQLRAGAVLRHGGGVNRAAWSADGQLVATASDDSLVRVFRWPEPRPVAVLTGHHGPVLDVAFSPDGVWVATAGEDDSVRIWDPLPGVEAAELAAHHGPAWQAAFSPDSGRVASVGQDGMLHLADRDGGRPLEVELGRPALALAWDPAGQRLAVAGRERPARAARRRRRPPGSGRWRPPGTPTPGWPSRRTAGASRWPAAAASPCSTTSRTSGPAPAQLAARGPGRRPRVQPGRQTPGDRRHRHPAAALGRPERRPAPHLRRPHLGDPRPRLGSRKAGESPPPAPTAASGSGTPRTLAAGTPAGPAPGTTTGWARWSSAPTAASWPAPRRTPASGSGTRRPARQLATLPNHSQAVRKILWSADGERLLDRQRRPHRADLAGRRRPRHLDSDRPRGGDLGSRLEPGRQPHRHHRHGRPGAGRFRPPPGPAGGRLRTDRAPAERGRVAASTATAARGGRPARQPEGHCHENKRRLRRLPAGLAVLLAEALPGCCRGPAGRESARPGAAAAASAASCRSTPPWGDAIARGMRLGAAEAGATIEIRRHHLDFDAGAAIRQAS